VLGVRTRVPDHDLSTSGPLFAVRSTSVASAHLRMPSGSRSGERHRDVARGTSSGRSPAGGCVRREHAPEKVPIGRQAHRTGRPNLSQPRPTEGISPPVDCARLLANHLVMASFCRVLSTHSIRLGWRATNCRNILPPTRRDMSCRSDALRSLKEKHF
jgi:hypothetical protein